MNGWGFGGPVWRIKYFHITYGTHMRVCLIDEADSIDLDIEEGCIKFDGKYYGDWTIFTGNDVE